ncbi:hypothetical protein GAP32_500 [Cronobacter phage vB_CsaM_GAP32]|uniref:Uncharacterized protein n=1 Tax=Cronobacter phage vB_CsaM_GAP32 TaxID=1141136 RepID=K4FB96_9CAUD|nr:hypothetical protein GAP32_500 [Cronobacter phage vB_CsaM_GAP32]AFC21959.1 hypothetical protein GAP32_500 [Cronobacter phage vB_CsaM_GAP32]
MNKMENAYPENLLKIRAVITINYIPTQPESELFNEVQDALRILIESYAKRNNSEKDHEYYAFMTETFLTDFQKYDDDVFIWFIRELTASNVCIKYKDVPMFKSVVQHYGPILRSARCMNIKPHELEEYMFRRNLMQ